MAIRRQKKVFNSDSDSTQVAIYVYVHVYHIIQYIIRQLCVPGPFAERTQQAGYMFGSKCLVIIAGASSRDTDSICHDVDNKAGIIQCMHA